MGCGTSKSTSHTVSSGSPKEEPQTSQKTEEKTVVKTKEDSYATPKNKTDSAFVEEALKTHNEYRSQHGAPPLQVANDLNDYAKQWAEQIAKKDTMEHSKCTMASGERLGENIYYCWSSDPSAGVKARDAVKSWYDEIKDYNYNNPTFGMNTGHFTQVVWKGTREMGIGTSQSSTGSHYVVASYRPPGNMMGDFEQNVLPKQ